MSESVYLCENNYTVSSNIWAKENIVQLTELRKG